MSEKTKTKTLTHQQELMRGFGFRTRDLAANREGRLTDEQSKRILETNFNTVVFSGCGSIVLLCLVTAAVVSIAYKQIFISVFFFVFFIPILILVLVTGQSAWQLRNDVKANKVSSVQGLAIVRSEPSYSLTVNNVNLAASTEAILRIKHLEPHIVYYLPSSKVVVSVEVIEEL